VMHVPLQHFHKGEGRRDFRLQGCDRRHAYEPASTRVVLATSPRKKEKKEKEILARMFGDEACRQVRKGKNSGAKHCQKKEGKKRRAEKEKKKKKKRAPPKKARKRKPKNNEGRARTASSVHA